MIIIEEYISVATKAPAETELRFTTMEVLFVSHSQQEDSEAATESKNTRILNKTIYSGFLLLPICQFNSTLTTDYKVSSVHVSCGSPRIVQCH